MAFKNDKQRKAVFSKLNKFCASSRPQDVFGLLGDKLASAVVKTYPSERTEGIYGIYPDRRPDQPTLDRIVENLVIDAYPDGGYVDDYGEAFAEGKAREWVDAADGVIDGRLDGKRLPRA